MKKLLFLMLLVTLSSMTVQAIDSGNGGVTMGSRTLGYFTMPELQVEPGQTFVLPISFTCEDPIRALGIYTTVPEGFEVISVEPTDRVIGSFQYATPTGACNIAIYDLNNQRVLAGTDGVVVNITLKAAENLSGNYTYTINRGDYSIVGNNGAFYPESVSTTVHVNADPTPGALGYFTMPELQVEPGQTFVLPVSFNCENSVYSLAFGVAIPDGFEVVSVEKGESVIGTFSHGESASLVNVAIYDFSGASAINGDDGVVVNITLKATENLSGDYTFTLSGGNYGIVGLVGNPQYPESVSTTVHVNAVPTPGDLGYFTMPELQVEPGQTFVLPISFTCEDPIRALGIYTTVPEGFEVISVEPTDRVIGSFQYATPAGACNMAIYDINNQRVLAGTDGVVVNITLKAAENLSGDYTYTINRSDYGIVGNDGAFYPESVSTTIHVNGTPTPGDLGYFTMPELQVGPGQTFVLPISFTCEDPVRALGIYTTVPEGFEVISVEPTDRVIGSFQYATPTGACNIAIYDLNNQRVLAGTDGIVVNITLKAAENLSGDYTYTINRGDYDIVGNNGAFYPESVSTTIHIVSLQGDVNYDNQVNITDVTILLNYLLNEDSPDDLPASADVNKDGNINVSDVTTLINMLLNHR